MRYERCWCIGRLTIKYERRVNDWMGRFGGGWNWKVGAQFTAPTLILDCLTFMVRFDWRKP